MLILKKQILNEAQSQRFEYKKGVAFWVRPLTGSIVRDLRNQETKTKMALNKQTKRMESVEEVDEEKQNDLIADHILEKWEGVGGEDGKHLPVTLESKKLILDQIPLREFVWAAAQSIEEAETKNS